MAKGVDVLGYGIRFMIQDDASGPLTTMGRHIRGVTSAAAGLVAGLLGVSTVITASLAVASRKLNEVVLTSIEAFRELDQTMKDIQRVTGMSSVGIDNLIKSYLELSSTLPLSAQELAEAGAQLGRLGIRGTKQLERTAFTAGKLANTTLLNTEESTKALGRLGKVYGLELASNADKLASALVKVSTTTTATAEDVARTTMRMGGMARAMGFTISETMALSGVIKDLGERPTVAATQMIKFMDRMSLKMEDFRKFLGMTKEEYIAAFNEKPMSILLGVLRKLGTLEKQELAPALRSIGVNAARMNRVFMGLISRVDDIEDEIKMANKAFKSGTELQKQYSVMAQSLNARIKTLLGSIKNLGIIVGQALAKPLKLVINILIIFMSTILKLPKPILILGGTIFVLGAAFVTALTLIGVVVTGLLAVLLAFLGMVSMIITGFTSLAIAAAFSTKALSAYFVSVNKAHLAERLHAGSMTTSTAIALVYQNVINKIRTALGLKTFAQIKDIAATKLSALWEKIHMAILVKKTLVTETLAIWTLKYIKILGLQQIALKLNILSLTAMQQAIIGLTLALGTLIVAFGAIVAVSKIVKNIWSFLNGEITKNKAALAALFIPITVFLGALKIVIATLKIFYSILQFLGHTLGKGLFYAGAIAATIALLWYLSPAIDLIYGKIASLIIATYGFATSQFVATTAGKLLFVSIYEGLVPLWGFITGLITGKHSLLSFGVVALKVSILMAVGFVTAMWKATVAVWNFTFALKFNPVTAIILGIVAAVVVLATALTFLVGLVWKLVKLFLGSFLKTLGVIFKAVSKLWGIFKAVFSIIWQIIKVAALFVTVFLAKALLPLIAALLIVMGIFKFIQLVVMAFINLLIDVFEPVVEAWNEFVEAINPLIERFKELFSGVGKGAKVFKTVMGILKTFLKVALFPIFIVIKFIAIALSLVIKLFTFLLKPLEWIFDIFEAIGNLLFWNSLFPELIAGIKVVAKLFMPWIFILEGILSLFKSLGKIISSIFGGGGKGLGFDLNMQLVAGNIVAPISGMGDSSAIANVGFGDMSASGSGGKSSSPTDISKAGTTLPDITLPITVMLDGRIIYETVKEYEGNDLLRKHVDKGSSHPSIASWE